jgi:Protein of unknown function (DUF3159)
MVRATVAAPAPQEGSLTEPSFRAIFGVGAASVLREGVLPLGAFYVGLRLGGLATGIAASTVVSVLLYGLERRAGREGLLVRLSLAFVLIQAAVGLLSNSTVVYLAQPVLATAIWGLAFVVSVPLGRPLAGALACAWYPFPQAFRESPAFKRVYGIESLVWAGYFLGRSALRLALLLHGSLEGFFAVTFVTGVPVTLLLLAWSIRYAIRSFSD